MIDCCCLCAYGYCSSCTNDQSQMYNSLIRVKTASHNNSPQEEISMRVASCTCFPIKCMAGIGMILSGIILCPIPCTICQIKTRHVGDNPSFYSLDCTTRSPNLPCYYEDEYQYNENHIDHDQSDSEGSYIISGYNGLCCGGNDETVPMANLESGSFLVKSSITGYQCITSGVDKVIRAVGDLLCCPIYLCAAGCGESEYETIQ